MAKTGIMVSMRQRQSASSSQPKQGDGDHQDAIRPLHKLVRPSAGVSCSRNLAINSFGACTAPRVGGGAVRDHDCLGLDIYVGSLTRHLIGDRELVTQKAAREMGLDLTVVREHDPDDATRDP